MKPLHSLTPPARYLWAKVGEPCGSSKCDIVYATDHHACAGEFFKVSPDYKEEEVITVYFCECTDCKDSVYRHYFVSHYMDYICTGCLEDRHPKENQ